MAVSLEVQRQIIRGDILRQTRTARAGVRSQAREALQRKPKTVMIREPLGTTMVISKEREREVEAWEREQLAAIESAEKAALAGLKKSYEEAKAVPRVDVEAQEREARLAAQRKYEEALGKAKREMEEDYVLVAGDQWVKKEGYEALSAEDKKLIQRVGAKAFGEKKERDFKADNIEIKSGIWVDKSWWGSLTKKQQASAEVRDGEVTVKGLPVVLTEAQGRKEFASWVAKGEAPDGTPISKDAVFKGIKNGRIEYAVPGKPEEVKIIGYSHVTKEVIIKFKSGETEKIPESEFPEFAKLTRKQKEDVALTDKYAIPGEKIYEVPTPEGMVEVPAKKWEAMTEFEQLTKILGRAPTSAEMEGIARPKMPSYEGVFAIPVLGDILSRLRLGVELAQPGIQSDVERYWKETLPEAARLKTQYLETMYPDVGRFEIGARHALEEWGFGVLARPLSPLVEGPSFKLYTPEEGPGIWPTGWPTGWELDYGDTTREQWRQAAISATIFGSPALFGATRVGLGRLRLATLKVPGPVTTGFRVVEAGFAKTRPFFKLVVESPKVRIGTGLERAGLSRTVSDAAFAAGRASKALKAAQRAVDKVVAAEKRTGISSPKYQQLAYNKWQAERLVQELDSVFLRTLKDLKLSSKQVVLLQRATGYKGLQKPITAYGKSVETVKATYKKVQIAERALRRAEASRIPWKRPELIMLRRTYRTAKARYEKAKSVSRAASVELRKVLKPRYGELLPEPRPYVAETPFQRMGLYVPEGPKPATPLGREPYMGEPGATSWSPLSPEAMARVQAIAARAEEAWRIRTGVKPFESPFLKGAKAELGVAVAEPRIALEPGGLWMPEVSPMGLPISPLILGPRAARTGIAAVELPGFKLAPGLGLYKPLALTPMAMLMPRIGVMEEAEVELAPGYAETIVAPARELSATERHALGTMTAAQRARLIEEGEELPWAVGRPIPGLRPIEGLRGLTLPWTGLAQVTGLALITGLAPIAGLKPVTRFEAVTRLAPITKLATVTKLVTVTKLAPVTKVVTAPRLRWFPFFWWPDGDAKRRKRIEEEEEEIGLGLEPYPGVFPEVFLEMPIELQQVVEPLRPRPIRLKRRKVLREKGVYPVAGFRVVR